MRCARTGTRRWDKMFRVVRIGRGAVANADRRVLIPVADLETGGAEHPADAAYKRFADMLSYLRSRGAVLLDRRDSTAVLFVFRIEFGGHADVSSANRPPLGVVRRQQAVAAPSAQYRSKLPAEIDRVGDAGVHAQRAGRRQLMDGVASQEDAAVRIAFGDHAAPRPDAGAEPLNVKRKAKRAAQITFTVHRLGCQVAAAIKHHETPHCVRGIDHAHVRPRPLTIDGDEKGRGLAAANLQEARRTEV